MADGDLLAPLSRPISAPVVVDELKRALLDAREPGDVRKVERDLEVYEKYLHASGYPEDEIRSVNEMRMRARWRLGQLLAEAERGAGPGRGNEKVSDDRTSFRRMLEDLELGRDAAMLAQRLAALPETELERALAAAHDDGFFATFSYLLDRARPYWYAASRAKRHRTIAAAAIDHQSADEVGPFPLLYADPPWKFEVYSAKGLDRTPDQHYPTLTDAEIAAFRVGGRSIPELAHTDAALLLWCTSSNLVRALAIMEQWGFTFKTSAVWIKDKSGLGLVFRVKHELLLYGVRGHMPGPQYQPQSVFAYPRGRHSAKPPEIRTEIERMYPSFDHRTRLELFARDSCPGWTSHGFEARATLA